MLKLSSLKTTLATLDSRLKVESNKNVQRKTGRYLQNIRNKMWQEARGKCEHCLKVVELNSSDRGFELDHIVPLFKGGLDSVENLQVLCIDCHELKTKEDLK